MDDVGMALIPVTSDAEAYEQLVTALYGDGAWEISKAQEKKKDGLSNADKTLVASNVFSAGLGVAAINTMRRQAKGNVSRTLPQKERGGIPRQAARASTKLRASKNPVLRKIGDAGAKSYRGMTRMGNKKAGAALVGAGLIGGSAFNAAADVGSAVSIANKGKPEDKKKVSKKATEIQPSEVKGKLVKAGVNTTFGAAKKAPKLKEKTASFVAKGEISKSVEDKRQVFGWASIVELNGEPVVDLQGDYMAIDVIEKAAYEYVNKSRKGSDMHAGHHASDLIESFIVTDEKKKLLNLPDTTPTGWWVGFKVNDDDLWQMVKDGKRPEFSIHGSGQRVDVEI